MAIIPGKWEVFRRDSGVTVVQSTHGGEEYMVARCYGDGDGDEVSTASLIAAAPELLAAAQAVRDDFRQFVFTDGYHRLSSFSAHAIVAVLDAAIAKAEGRTDDQ